MANTFKNSKNDTVTTVTTIYTVPASTTTVLIGLIVSNVDASATVTIAVSIGDGAENHLAKNLPILPGSSIELVEGKIVMLTTETLKVTSTGGAVDVVASYMEQT